MTVEERKRVVEIVTDEVAGRCPLIAHIGMIATRDALDLARHAKSCGVDAMASVPPFYYRFSQEELEQYYLDLVDAVDLPMFLYNKMCIRDSRHLCGGGRRGADAAPHPAR